MSITTRIKDSDIDIEFTVDHYEDEDQAELLMRAWDLARAAVDIFCFTSGWGLTVYLDTLIKPDGSTSTILPQDTRLATYCKAFDVNPQNKGSDNFDNFYRLVMTEPPLFMALNDLIISITLPHHAAVNCARAVDGIRNMMVPAGGDRKQSWLLMRENLNVVESYLTFVTGVSIAPRHGDRKHIPGPIVTETVKRSWIIMDRFLEFRKRGNCPLPIDLFPLLDQ